MRVNLVTKLHDVRRAIPHTYFTSEAPDLDEEAAIQVAVKSINDYTGADGVVKPLLVYGALTRLGIPSDKPTSSTFWCAVARQKATDVMSKHFAKTQVSSAVRTRNGPDTFNNHSAPIDSHVLVCRPKLDRWDGLFPQLEIKGETCTVLLPPPFGAKQFRTTIAKRFTRTDISRHSTAT